MKIILLQDVRGVGKKFDVLEVSDGYAKNFLIAKKLAAPATGVALAGKSSWEAQQSAELKRYKTTAERLAKEPLNFKVKADAKGAVFGSVSKEDLIKEFKKKGFEFSEIVLPKSIKALGEHKVEVRLGRGVVGQAKIVVEANE